MNNLVAKEDIASLVRNYVHYDNLTSQFFKQTQNSRAVRDNYEQRIIDELKKNKMENAVIQIVGGKLKVVEEKHGTPLSFKNLEESLHDYFIDKKKVDETRDVVKFIKSKRTFETSYKLKKIPQLPPQPLQTVQTLQTVQPVQPVQPIQPVQPVQPIKKPIQTVQPIKKPINQSTQPINQPTQSTQSNINVKNNKIN